MKRNLIFAFLALFVGIIATVYVVCVNFFYPQQYVKNEKGDYVRIEVAQNPQTFPITKNTLFEIEHFYVDENRSLKEEVDEIPALLGCDKDDVTKYLEDYMKHLTKEEKEEGLISYELVSYQGNRICLRKTYQKQEYSGFIAKSFNGTLVILQGDGKTVYEYTQIPIHVLPDDLQEKVLSGYPLEDEEALYNFLETYSS